MNRVARADYEAALVQSADKAFQDHVLDPQGRHAHWTLRHADGSGFYWTEILWLPRGFFLIHGDIAMVLVRVPMAGDRRKCLDWIGNSDPRYIAEKVGAAVSDPDFGFTYSAEVAAHELAEMTEQPDAAPANLEAWTEALEQLEAWGYTVPAIIDHVMRDTGDSEFSVGRVVDARIFYAQAAARRLLALLPGDPAPASDSKEGA